MGAISSVFGVVLNFIYNFVQNYGVAIILFSILLKLVMLPLSVKQQKTMRKTAKLQGRVKDIQKKYKNDPEKMNREVMDLYKRENMSPFSGCLSGIVQIVLLFAMFYLVKDPLTYMKQIDPADIETYKNEIRQEVGENAISATYPEISIVKYIQEKGQVDSELYIDMDLLGLDLSNVPQENWKNPSVYIIPILYVISSFISIKLINNMNIKNNQQKEVIVDKDGKPEPEMPDMAAQMNKTMVWMLPAMSVFISIIAPLGLALYWLLNNVLMIVERLVLNKYVFSKEEEEGYKN